MKTRSQWFSQPLVFALALSSAVSGSPAQEGFLTEEPTYISPTSRGNYQFRQVLSIGDKVPLTGSTTGKFQFVGFPEGVGGYRTTLLGKTVIKLLIGNRLGYGLNGPRPPLQPIVGGTPFRGSFVSEFTLSTDGSVLSGAPAYDAVWNENTYVGPIPKTDNTTPALGFIQDLKLVGPESGFDRQIAFAAAVDGFQVAPVMVAGQRATTLAIFDRQAYLLPKFGNFAQAGHAIQARTDGLSVIFPLNNAGVSTDIGPHSHLFMFVGTKDTRSFLPGLRKNGLDNGRLFILMSGSGNLVYPERRPLNCRWVALPDEIVANGRLTQDYEYNHPLVTFDGVVAGAFDKTNRNKMYFVTEGQDYPEQVAPFGCLYEITLATDPRQDCGLRRIFDAEAIVNTRQDFVLSPNQVETRGDYLFLSDTRTSGLPPGVGGAKRGNSIWSFKISDGFSSLREAQLDRQPFAFIRPVEDLSWRVEGLVDASNLLNRPDTFFAIAQVALNFFAEPLPVRDGQLLLMFKTDL